jgi:ribonuclease Z
VPDQPKTFKTVQASSGKGGKKMKRFMIIAMILASMVLCVVPAHAEPSPKVLLIPREGNSRDIELMLTKEIGVMVAILEKAGFEVVVATASGAPIAARTTTLRPDLKLSDVKVADYAGFILACKAVGPCPGIPQPAEAVAIAKKAVAQGKLVAAQNGAVCVLVEAGVLKGKRYAFPVDPLTTSRHQFKDTRFTGAIYSGYGVVQDGNIITSGSSPFVERIAGLPDRTEKLTNVLVAQLKSGPVALEPDIKVTLLGTGTPAPVLDRFGPSTLVEAGGKNFLFDAGRGAMQRLWQIGVPWRDVHGVFLTHLHSDHVVGFPDLWLTGWNFSRRQVPLHVWGPRGTRKMMSHLEQAYEYDIRIRLHTDRTPPDGVVILAEDISEGVVYEQGGVKITAFEVDHAPIKPAFGYRIDYAGRSVVLSGDTRVCENLIRYAQGVDVLVHEVASAASLQRVFIPPGLLKIIVDLHTTPEQAGDIFARTQPKLAVYTHIVGPAATEQDLIPPTRKTYSGPLELGEDLMVIEVGENIEVRRSTPKK